MWLSGAMEVAYPFFIPHSQLFRAQRSKERKVELNVLNSPFSIFNYLGRKERKGAKNAKKLIVESCELLIGVNANYPLTTHHSQLKEICR